MMTRMTLMTKKRKYKMNKQFKLLIVISILLMGLIQCSKEETEEKPDYPVNITEENADEEIDKLLKEIDSL